jgi:hypothetical protein
MLFNFLVPYYPFIGVATPFLTSYIVNTLFLLSYSRIFNSELDENRFLMISFLLVLVDFAALFVGGMVSGAIVKAPYWLWGDWRLMDELARRRDLLAPLDAVVGGAILGYASSFAFVSVNRKHLITSWIVANSISILIFVVFFTPHFCGLQPYLC